ncbi:protein-tyrosine phosphatase [Abditibacterium utsteinense]|uniref:protein-tyrosine-phosphatase n=2 Tax=Abditibacterium utsteinense TaxID=1960156 RepID=A0A2S8SVN1_9BACT|nr:protein-tyrosine phosphatase [Abditibacterium utsteinense]
MAESVFLHQVRAAGLEAHIEVDSAGTGDWHIGDRPHDGTLEILRVNGIPEGSRARQIRVCDLSDFDYLVVMDNSNLANVQKMGASRARISRLLDWVPESDVKEVPDPYFTGDFAETYDLVQRGSAALLKQVRAQHLL